MQGLVGWLQEAAIDGENTVRRMLDVSGRRGEVSSTAVLGASWGAAVWGGSSSIHEEGSLITVVVGRPRFAAAPSGGETPAAVLTRLWRRHGPAMLRQIHGTFALAVLDREAQSALLAIDRIGSHSLAFAARSSGIVFADRVSAVASHPSIAEGLDPQGLFNYFYFHEIPAPGSAYRGVEKLLPGEQMLWRRGTAERSFYWRLHYRDEPRADFDAQSARFHSLLRDCVRRAKGDDDAAAFLSGGTDSSTVCGVLTEMSGRPARVYSIGFDAEGFDEMEYARIAAKRFGLDAREYYLQPDDVLSAISVIAEHYDEPFANESAVPVYYCAKCAAEDGYRVMLAGDGGDEIFGGNARYAKQKVFEAYYRIPGLVRDGLIEPVAGLPGMDRIPPARKLQSYIRQAKVALPERLETYNFVYRQPLGQMFSPELLSAVDVRLPSASLKDVYDRADTTHFINRMLHLDLKFTLADNDLRKVNRMTEAAGIEVRYPLLDDEMVEFSGEVPPDWKVKGQYLRWFFKTALKGFLPDEIINKSKHGFGLPFGLWLKDHKALRERAEDRLSDFKRRDLLKPAYVDYIRNEHMTGHATYFGSMIWVILILEEWLAARGL